MVSILGKIGYSTVNARAETVTASPVFREAMKRRRCLVPATCLKHEARWLLLSRWSEEGMGAGGQEIRCCKTRTI